MRLAFISDIHGNLKALESALKAIQADEIYCLGDIVDRYTDSDECITQIKDNCKLNILGNHDILPMKYGYCDEMLDPKIGRVELSEKSREYLVDSPFSAEVGDLFLSHTLQDFRFPDWAYIISESDAFGAFGLLKKKIAVIGHTHEPKIFEEKKLNENEYEITKHALDKDQEKLILEIIDSRRYIIDAGSIGYSHDDYATGHYAIIEDGRIGLKRFRI